MNTRMEIEKLKCVEDIGLIKDVVIKKNGQECVKVKV